MSPGTEETFQHFGVSLCIPYRNLENRSSIKISSDLFHDWQLKWLSCLIPGAVAMATSIMAILGVISEPWLLWKGRIVLSLMLHPMHFVFAFVVLFFSMVSLSDIVDRPICFRLVAAAVTSQWGVIFSTLALCFGRAVQILFGTVHIHWSKRAECALVPAALILVLVVHTTTILLSDISLSVKAVKLTGPLCPVFFTTTDMFPRRIMGYFIVSVVFLITVSLAVIITSMRKRRSLLVVGDMHVDNVMPHQPYPNNPPNDVAPPILNNLMGGEVVNRHGHDHDYNENAGPSQDGAYEMQEPPRASTGQSTSHAHPSRQRTSDFYDYQQQRHRVQSPPPPTPGALGPYVWSTQQPPAPCPVLPPPPDPDPSSMIRQAPPVRQDHHAHRLDPPLPPANQQAPPPQPADNHDDARLILPDVFLQMIFPHRDTANKPRFPYTKVQRTREFSWPVQRPGISRRPSPGRAYPLDLILCLSGVLFVLAYLPLACYLLYTSDDSVYNFTDESFHPYVITLLLKSTIDSLIFFVGLQCVPWVHYNS